MTQPTPAPFSTAHTDGDEVRAAIQAFADGAAAQNVALLEGTLHPASVQFVTGAPMTRMERGAYLDLVGTRQIGGQPLAVDVRHLTIHGDTAQAAATFTAEAYTLNHTLSLARANGRWVIVSTVVSCTH